MTSEIIKNKQYENSKKSAVIAYILWFFLGWFAIHRFYIKDFQAAILHLVLVVVSFAAIDPVSILTGLALTLWLIIDIFTLYGKVKDYNSDLINEIFSEGLDKGV